MSAYVRYYNNRKTFYRDLAVSWAKWASNAQLSVTEQEGMSKFFSSIAKRFGLIKEFANLGLIN